MLDELNIELARRAVADRITALESPEDIYLDTWHFAEPLDDKGEGRLIGMCALVLTEAADLNHETYSVSLTHEAIGVNPESARDRKLFFQAYKQMVGGAQKYYTSPREAVDPDEPDIEETIVGRVAVDLAQQNIVTLGGFMLAESKRDGKTIYGANIFCAKALAQNLALEMREAMLEVESRLDEFVVETKEDEEFFKMLSDGIKHGKTLPKDMVIFSALNYMGRKLPPSKEMRKLLSVAPPKNKKK